MAEWFEEWFGDDYLALYPHRDEQDAERAVTLITDTMPWRPGLRVLDIACGPGRHAAAFEARDAHPIGIDLSLVLLRRAQRISDGPLARADMRRLPVRDASVDLAVNLFTSFGYFSSDDQHRNALTGMVATVRPGGWFALDFLNAGHVRATLTPEGTGTMGDIPVRVTRRISDDDRYVIKEIDPGDGRVFREQVRLFSPGDLEAMLASHVDIVGRFGDYEGGALTATSPRAFLIGEKR